MGQVNSYKVPLQLGDGLDAGSILETRIDTTALNSLMNDILENYNYMHSLLVKKDGKLVVEEYFNGWDPVRFHRLQSVTKSYTSTLVGLALKLGYIITKKSGMNILEFSFKYLFEPLGTERAYWWALSRGSKYRPGCAGGLRLTSRDMAKYGLLYLRGGVWNEKQIVDRD